MLLCKDNDDVSVELDRGLGERVKAELYVSARSLALSLTLSCCLSLSPSASLSLLA